MSKKKVTLEEAKRILGTDKIFYNGDGKFNVVDVGKYNSGISIVIPQEWNVNKDRQAENPIEYICVKELTDGMNIDFDGNASFMLGEYHLSKNGRPVFEITEPTKAKNILIKVSWGGAFNKTRGQYNNYAKESEALFFTKKSSNGGGMGNDYWILPTNYVKDHGSRDVSKILEEIEEKSTERIAQIESYIAQEDSETKSSIENRDRILENIQPIIQSIQKINPEFTYDAKTENFTYREKSTWGARSKRYTDDLVRELTEILAKVQNEKEEKGTYLPLYQAMESTLRILKIEICYNDTNVTLKAPNSYLENKCYRYQEGENAYNEFINDIAKYQEKIAQEKEEIRRKAEEIRRSAELNIRKESAKELGYPEEFKFYNRLYGATNISHAYVIQSNGIIREPDYNNLNNSNHKHKYSDWKNEADGTQGYQQILPEEIIVTYTKSCTSAPYIFDIVWADSEITEAQLEVICDKLEEKADFAEDINGEKIINIKQWVIDSVKAKAIECRKQLNIEEKSEEDMFYTEIVGLAEEKAKAKEKNNQAKQLANAYEAQLPSRTLED